MASSQSRIGVLWEGSFFVYHSLALVNREMALGLLADERIDLGLIPYEQHQFGPEVDPRFEKIQKLLGRRPDRIDFHVRHRWPPSFEPTDGKFILVQPWEFGSLPVGWVNLIQQRVARVWAYSSYVRQVYIQSGINPDSVTVVPVGINPNVFHPGGSSPILNRSRKFKFLFVGGTILRKGIDVLLQAYITEFSRDDDVCLVVKDFGTRSFYKGRTWGSRIEEIQQRPNVPEIIYYAEDIPEREMANLYRACDCLVHPYRGEGFGLPIAEAMACGLPVIVTGFGACLDFCNSENSYLIESELKVASEKRVGDIETISYPYWAEPSMEHLRSLMRYVYEHPEHARQIGAKAALDIRSRFTWSNAVEIAVRRLLELDGVHSGNKGFDFTDVLRPPQDENPIGNADTLLRQGVAKYSQGDVEAAIALLERSIELDPGLDIANYNLATIYADRGDYETSFRYITEYLRRVNHDGQAWALLGGILVNLGDLLTAKLAYEQAVTRGYDTNAVSQILSEITHATLNVRDTYMAGWYRRKVTGLLGGVELCRNLPFGSESKRQLANPVEGVNSLSVSGVGQEAIIRPHSRLNVIWIGPAYDPSGYGDEIRNMVVNLPDNRFDLRIIAPPGSRREGDLISGAMREKLLSFERSTIYPEDAIVVQHVPAWLFTTELRGRVNIGRTMFEANGLPSDWVAKCNQMDEVWVPATFNADTFSRAGVDQSKIRVVPGGIDPDVFSPSASPLSIPRARGFKFLSNFDWNARKGWDVLLEAYVSEFNRSEDVTLVLKVSRNRAFTPRPVMYNILEFMVNHLHKDPDNAPNIVVIEGVIPDADLPGLYTACDAFVLPSRGEGWGRPYMEAMSCGLPVIGTKWSGNLDFMNDSNSFLIDIEGLQQVTPSSDTALWCYLGQYWAQPSVEHLRTLMRQVFENTELSKSKGRKAREDVIANWTWQRVASIVEKELLKFA